MKRNGFFKKIDGYITRRNSKKDSRRLNIKPSAVPRVPLVSDRLNFAGNCSPRMMRVVEGRVVSRGCDRLTRPARRSGRGQYELIKPRLDHRAASRGPTEGRINVSSREAAAAASGKQVGLLRNTGRRAWGSRPKENALAVHPGSGRSSVHRKERDTHSPQARSTSRRGQRQQVVSQFEIGSN